jgi:hypothetical protein
MGLEKFTNQLYKMKNQILILIHISAKRHTRTKSLTKDAIVYWRIKPMQKQDYR